MTRKPNNSSGFLPFTTRTDSKHNISQNLPMCQKVFDPHHTVRDVSTSQPLYRGNKTDPVIESTMIRDDSFYSSHLPLSKLIESCFRHVKPRQTSFRIGLFNFFSTTSLFSYCSPPPCLSYIKRSSESDQSSHPHMTQLVLPFRWWQKQTEAPTGPS